MKQEVLKPTRDVAVGVVPSRADDEQRRRHHFEVVEVPPPLLLRPHPRRCHLQVAG